MSWERTALAGFSQGAIMALEENEDASVIDLVGAPPRLQTIEGAPNNGRALSIAQQTRRLLTGKGGGS